MANHQHGVLAHSSVAGRGMSGAARMQCEHKAKWLSHVLRGMAGGLGGLVVPLLAGKPSHSPAERKSVFLPGDGEQWRVNEVWPGKRRDGRTPGKACSAALDPTRTGAQMESWWHCLGRLLQSVAPGKRRSDSQGREVERSERPCTQIKNQHL